MQYEAKEVVSENVAPLTRGQLFNLKALAESYMACYQGRDSQVGTRLAFFVERLGDKVAAQIDADDIADTLDALAQRGCLINRGGTKRGGTIHNAHRPLAPATLNRYRSTIQAVLTWGRKKRLMPKGWVNPVNDTEPMPVDNARTRYLTEAEYDRLLKAARVSYWPKLALLIKMAVTTGARRGALFGLRWEDIDLEAGRAFVQRTKNGEPFVMVLLPEVVEELRRFEPRAKPEHLVFCSSISTGRPMNHTKAWKNALANAGIKGAVCFHTLRHTHASWLAKRGAPLLAIADSLGHKSLAMTKRYAHLCVDSRADLINRVFSKAA